MRKGLSIQVDGCQEKWVVCRCGKVTLEWKNITPIVNSDIVDIELF